MSAFDVVCGVKAERIYQGREGEKEKLLRQTGHDSLLRSIERAGNSYPQATRGSALSWDSTIPYLWPPNSRPEKRRRSLVKIPASQLWQDILRIHSQSCWCRDFPLFRLWGWNTSHGQMR